MLQQLPNPDNVPGAVTTGYQRQNTNIFAIQTGLDTSEPRDDGNGFVHIPRGGIIEVNGVMFKITGDITLQKDEPDTMYWLAVNDNGDGTATIELSPKAGMWDSTKQGFYNLQNQRILNWNSFGTFDENYIIDNELPLVFSQTVKGEWNISLQSGWYIIDLMSGLGGGRGGDGSAGPNVGGGAGGGGIPYLSNRIFRMFHYNIHEDRNKGIYNRLFHVMVGGNGGNGINGSNGNQGSLGPGGGGGGGGSGSGEESKFDDIVCRAFNGGNGGTGGAGAPGAGAPAPGGVNGNNGAGGGNTSNGLGGFGGTGMGSYQLIVDDELITIFGGSGGGGGGAVNGSGRPGGRGGDGGIHGRDREDGIPGGYCNIFAITG